MPKPEEYVWIKKWSEMMASSPSFIRQEQRRAAQQDAPLDATYAIHGGGWATIADITGAQTRARLGLPPLPTPPTLVDQIYTLVTQDDSELAARIRALIEEQRQVR